MGSSLLDRGGFSYIIVALIIDHIEHEKDHSDASREIKESARAGKYQEYTFIFVVFIVLGSLLFFIGFVVTNIQPSYVP